MLYTGGTTGMPKGVLWRQEDIFRSALYPRPRRELRPRWWRTRAAASIRALPAPPFMHGAAHWVAFNMWFVGGTIVVQSHPDRLDPADIWSTVARERVSALTIVGDAFGRPLADELRRGRYDVSSLRLLTSGGAILTASLKRELHELLPGVRLLDALGSSESGAQAQSTPRRTPAAPRPAASSSRPAISCCASDLSGPVAPGSGEQGWLARSGAVPLGYFRDPEKTAKTFPVIDGVRYAVPGDRAMLEADGRLRLLGRDSVTINTGGEKVFAEEVEQALKHHPAVYDAVVVGTPHARWGQQVTALVRLRAGESPSEEALLAVARAHVAAYKLPEAVRVRRRDPALAERQGRLSLGEGGRARELSGVARRAARARRAGAGSAPRSRRCRPCPRATSSARRCASRWAAGARARRCRRRSGRSARCRWPRSCRRSASAATICQPKPSIAAFDAPRTLGRARPATSIGARSG